MGPFLVACRFVLSVFTKYCIRDLASIETLLQFVGIQTRRLYLVHLGPFELKKIELNYFRGRKEQKRKKEPIAKTSSLNKIEESKEDSETELDDPENYLRVKKRDKVSSQRVV